MKLIIDIPEKTFICLKNMLEAECVDAYSLADIIVNKGTPASTEGDLISRSELKKKFGYTDEWYKSRTVAQEIDNAPTVELTETEVQEVLNKRCMTAVANEYLIALHGKRPQGEWNTDCMCSVCKKYVDYTTDYCPNCGADMRGGVK